MRHLDGWANRPRRGRLAGCDLLLVALSLGGCTRPGAPPVAPSAADSATLAVGTSIHTLQFGGVERTYRVYRPASLPASAAPLVLMLHGGFGSGEQAEASYGWDAAADHGHFVVAYPDGLNHAWAVGGGCCGAPGRAAVDDVGFITQVVAAVSRAASIDPARVYATGISNGGMLAYRLACDTTVFAAIGPDSATLLGGCPAPSPASVIHVHGTADHSVRYDGGRGDGVASIDGPSVPAMNATWRAVDACTAPVVVVDGSVTTSTASCPRGRAVVLVTIAGAGHQWPGAVPKPVAEKLLRLDPPSTALDATSTIWAFFAAHSKTAA